MKSETREVNGCNRNEYTDLYVTFQDKFLLMKLIGIFLKIMWKVLSITSVKRYYYFEKIIM